MYALIALRKTYSIFIGYDVPHDSIQCNGIPRQRPAHSGGGMAACAAHFLIILGHLLPGGVWNRGSRFWVFLDFQFPTVCS
jgi:hypothetical protein